MSRNNKRTSKFGTPRKALKEKELDLSRRTFEKAYEEPSKARVIMVGIAILAIFMLLAYNVYKGGTTGHLGIENVVQQAQKKQAKVDQTELKRRYEAYQKKVAEGDIAYAAENYFEATFHYKQATEYDKNNVSLYEKLIAAYNKSCELGNEIHCNKEGPLQEQIDWITEQGILSLEDQKDSFLIQTSR